MALNQAQLLSGDSSKGTVLSGLVQGVKAGTGIAIAADGTISINNATLTSVVKLNNPAAYNNYVWPTSGGAAGTFLKTDNAGNLSWQTTGATVTVQSQPAPTGATEGDLWFDCTEGAIKIYQSCIAPAGWTQLGQVGYPAEANNTSSPDIVSGGGSSANPYILPAFEVPSGESALLPYVITVTNVAPGQFIPVVDVNNSINESRFDVNNRYADISGVLRFQPIFTDIPPSPQGTSFTALARIGNPGSGSSVYVELPINITNPLFIQPGAISGNPAEGETLTYTQGAINGGQAPYIKAQAWLKNGVYIPGETGTTYDVTAADNGSVITVEYTVVDQNGYRTSAITAPVGPIGAIALPSNTSANPTFVTGDGTITNPFQLTSINVGAGTSSLFPQVITITGLDPQEFIPIVDRNVDVNGGRFTFTNSYANGAGDLTFQVRFSDTPESTEGSGYTALIQAGSNSVYFEGTAGVNQALTVSPGYISGNPTLNSTLTYNVGTAAGGVSPYVYSYQWLRNENPISGATGTTYTATSADLGTNLTVKITVRDNQNTTATALSAAFGPISTAAFPDTSWDPLPSNGMDTIPGGVSGEYNGTGSVITTTGCIEASVNGGAYKIGSQACVSGDTLAIRWNTGASCGGASSGTTITGTLTDGAYTNDYSITIDRVPNSLPNVSTTSAALNTLQSKTIPQTITGINAPAYVTYSSASTGTSIQASKDGGANYTTLATSGKGFSVDVGDNLIIRQRVGQTADTTYSAIIRVGDGTNTVGTYDEFTYEATTTSSQAWPKLPNALKAGPKMIPEVVSAVWQDGNGTVSSNGCIEVSNNNSTWGTSVAVTAGVTTLYVRWKGAYNGGGAPDGNCGNDSEGTTITGSIYGGFYSQEYSLTLLKIPPNFTISALGNQNTNTVVYSAIQTWSGTNSPANIWAASSSTLTNIQVSRNGGAWTNLTSSGTNVYVDPGSTIQFRGTTGSGLNTTYTMNLHIRDNQGAGVDTTWNVTTATSVPTIETPTILGPVSGASVNVVATGSTTYTAYGSSYVPLNGAGSPQTSSTWDLYKNSVPLTSTNTVTKVTNIDDSGITDTLSPLDPGAVYNYPFWNWYVGSEYTYFGAQSDQIVSNNPPIYTDLYSAYATKDLVDSTWISNTAQLSQNTSGSWRSVKWVWATKSVAWVWAEYGGYIGININYVYERIEPYSLDLLTPRQDIPMLDLTSSTNGFGGVWFMGEDTIVVAPANGTYGPYGYLYVYTYGDESWTMVQPVPRDGTTTSNWYAPQDPAGGSFTKLYQCVFQYTGFTPYWSPKALAMTTDGYNWVQNYEIMQSGTSPIQNGFTDLYNIGENKAIAKKYLDIVGNSSLDWIYTNDGGQTWIELTTMPANVSWVNVWKDEYFICFVTEGSGPYTGKIYWSTDPDQGWTFSTDYGSPPISFDTIPYYYGAQKDGLLLIEELPAFYDNKTRAQFGTGSYFNYTAGSVNLIPAPLPYTELTIQGAEDDGFVQGFLVETSNRASNKGQGRISTVTNTIMNVSETNNLWQVGDRVETQSDSYVAYGPYSGVTGALTSVQIPLTVLDPGTDYFIRTQYATTNSVATTSEYSPWSYFRTLGELTYTPGSALGGGAFITQMLLNGVVYNLILSKWTEDYNGVTLNGANSTSIVAIKYNGSGTTQQLTDNNTDGAANTVFQNSISNPSGLEYQASDWAITDITAANNGTWDPTNTTLTGMGGYNDWYLPAIYEMTLLFYYAKPVNKENWAYFNNEASYPYSMGSNPMALPDSNYLQTWSRFYPAQANSIFTAGSYTLTAGAGSYGYLNTSSIADGSYAWIYNTGGNNYSGNYVGRATVSSMGGGTRLVRKFAA